MQFQQPDASVFRFTPPKDAKVTEGTTPAAGTGKPAAPQVKGTPIVAVSGLMGEGIDRLMTAIQDAYAVWNKRVPTATLNRWFEQAVDANPPPAVSGRRLKLNYITQAKARPPSFILFCSRADAVPQSYLRYLTNSMREAFDLPGTPIRITLREKANPFAHKRKRPS